MGKIITLVECLFPKGVNYLLSKQLNGLISHCREKLKPADLGAAGDGPASVKCARRKDRERRKRRIQSIKQVHICAGMYT